MPILPQPPLSPLQSKVLEDHLAPLRPGRWRGPLAVGGRQRLQALKGAGIGWLPWALDGLGQGPIAPVTCSSGHGAIVGPVIRGSVGCYAAAATPQLHLCTRTAAASDAEPQGIRVWGPEGMISWPDGVGPMTAAPEGHLALSISCSNLSCATGTQGALSTIRSWQQLSTGSVCPDTSQLMRSDSHVDVG